MFVQLRLVKPPNTLAIGRLEPTLSAAPGGKLGLRVEGGGRASLPISSSRSWAGKAAGRSRISRRSADRAAATEPPRPWSFPKQIGRRLTDLDRQAAVGAARSSVEQGSCGPTRLGQAAGR
jgi:hypothetical protein